MSAQRAFRLRMPRVPELALHQQIAAVLAIEIAPPRKVSKAGVVWWSIDIAAYSGSTPGLRTSRGVVAGIPDILVLYRGGAFCIEVKAADGEISLAQEAAATAILIAGARYGVARNADEALDLLDAWSVPRNRRIRGVDAHGGNQNRAADGDRTGTKHRHTR